MNLTAPTGDERGEYDDTGERCPACRRKWSKHWWDGTCTEQATLVVETRPVCDRCGVTRTPGHLTCPCPEWDVRPDAPPVALTITRPHDADTPTG